MTISTLTTMQTGQRTEPTPYTKFLAVLVLIMAGALVFATVQNSRNSKPQTPVASFVPRSIEARGDLASDEQSTIELFHQAAPSVVNVTSLALRRSRLSLNATEIAQGTGSGFLWDSAGHIVTNYHVIKDGSGAEVTLSDNTTWRADIVGKAPDKDLAILKISAPEELLRPLAVGTSADLQVGQKVFAIGNPFGLDHTLTTGVISGLGREIQSVTRRPIHDVIQTDAAINPGNSGGPLLDSAGRLIGINTAIFSPSGAYAGVGFAVPVDTINRIIPQLIAHGGVVRPGLGITIAADQLAARQGIRGVLIRNVPPDSPAERAGLQGFYPSQHGWIIGDVIVGIDDMQIDNTNDLYRALDPHAVGDKVVIHVVNQKERRSVELVLQQLPNEE